MKKNINIFVYGSLREGFFNYDKYLKGKILSVTPAKINNMIIYHMPYKGYPAIIEGKGTVYGEIMEINPSLYKETVTAMDKMEGFISLDNPDNEYNKKLFEVEHMNDSKKEQCYVYYYNKDYDEKFSSHAVLINHGNWAEYMNK